MAEVVFATTRHVYDSYSDWRALVRLSGYDLVFVDEIDAYDPTKCYILTPLNGEWEQGWPDAKATIIHWDLEWRMDGPYPQIPGVARTWTSDRWYATRTSTEYVPLGSHPGLADDSGHDLPKQYDLAMLAYMGPPRRQQVANDCLAKGLTLAPNAWSEARDQTLKQSRAMLHVHQHEGVNTVAPGRVALAAAYRLPYFTETITDPGIFGTTHWLMSDRAHMADFVHMWLRTSGQGHLQDIGHALHRLLCQRYTFRVCVEAAL